jgi:hypothetical protein
VFHPGISDRGAEIAARARRCGIVLAVVLAACSPEATRHRDGGPGADPGNKRLVAAPPANPRAADTTLWPGRAPTPVERLAHKEHRSPAGATSR